MPCTLPASLADAAVCRGSFHAVLGGEAGEAVFADFSAALQKAQAEGRILTASLFRYENHLFFYAEGLNRPFTPQGLCPALDAALRVQTRVPEAENMVFQTYPYCSSQATSSTARKRRASGAP